MKATTLSEELLAGGKQRVAAVGPECTVLEAARVIRDRRIGCLIVNDEAGECLGIVTDRDISTKVAAVPLGNGNANGGQGKLVVRMQTGTTAE